MPSPGGTPARMACSDRATLSRKVGSARSPRRLPTACPRTGGIVLASPRSCWAGSCTSYATRRLGPQPMWSKMCCAHHKHTSARQQARPRKSSWRGSRRMTRARLLEKYSATCLLVKYSATCLLALSEPLTSRYWRRTHTCSCNGQAGGAGTAHRYVRCSRVGRGHAGPRAGHDATPSGGEPSHRQRAAQALEAESPARQRVSVVDSGCGCP